MVGVRSMVCGATLLLLSACKPTPTANLVDPPGSDVATADAATADSSEPNDDPTATATTPAEPVLRVHEWGTFTSRVDGAGKLAVWTRKQAVEPLPSFVNQNWTTPDKQQITGTVRMETPVLYFYAPEPGPVGVHVEFVGGDLTEWYPAAELGKVATGASLDWPVVEVIPGPDFEYPIAGDSHYYAARNTDADPLQVHVGDRVEQEKLLFYRGVGSFDHPIGVHYQGGKLELDARVATPAAFLVERQSKRFGFQALGALSGKSEVDLYASVGSLDELREAMQAALVGAGLYEREAIAMLDTWDALWFEEGTRLLYIVPREFTDSILPLTLDPAPGELERVFVGRLDLVDHK